MATVTAMMLAAVAVLAAGVQGDLPKPFSRELAAGDHGQDVLFLQQLLSRTNASLVATGTFGASTTSTVRSFQGKAGLSADGIVGPLTAQAVLDGLHADGYSDDGQTPHALGYLYKVHIPVHRNRSIETNATLLSANGTVLFSFRVRTHGAGLYEHHSWPDFNNTDPGRNQFSSLGNTPTGLAEFDLNSPEGEPRPYGPYPVNRMVKGLKGNAALVVPTMRYGILMHTGEWPDWSPPEAMPNSEGCIHSWPYNIKHVSDLLQAEGVKIRPNPFGTQPYPFQPQGLLSVELLDD